MRNCRFVSALMALAVGFAPIGSVSAAVIGYWQFDDAAAGTTANSLASQVNGLTGTAQASGSGAKPVHAADVPGPLVYDGLLGGLLNAANSTSLKFDNPSIPVNPNSADGGRVSVTDPGGAGSVLKPRNFTAEVFYKAEGHVNYPTLFGKSRADSGGGSWLLDTSGNDTFRVRVDSQALGLGSGNSGFNQSFPTSINLADGKWHHLALTYDDATRRAELYVDYVLRGGGTTVYPIVYDDRPLLMGQGAGGRALDGWMDEVRVSGGVLAPDQFLRAGATLEWDGGDADGSNGAGGGSGTWDTDTTANWYPGSGTSDVVWSSATLNNAVFGGTGGTVSISGPVSARSLTFDSAGYTVQNGTLTLVGPWITANQDAAIASTLAGSAGLVKDGWGTQVFSGANTYSGGTTVSGGTLLVNNPTGSGTGSGGVAVNNTATLGGTGSITGMVTVNAGGTHAPGASVGSQTVGGETWMPGGRFEFEINDALGQPGGPIGWDELLVGGTLDLTNLSAQDPFHIDIVSLAGTSPGDIDNFVATLPNEWPFLQYETLVGEFSPDLFSLDSAGFSNFTGRGHFEILQMEYNGANWLAIGYVPEPGTCLLLLSALACGMLVRRRPQASLRGSLRL